MALKMTAAEVMTFLADVFPQVGGDFTILDLSPDHLRVKLTVQDKHLRPGGTVSGPSMFGLADVALYILTLARIGPEALAVTTNASVDFLRKPAADADLIAEARVLKAGRVLVVGDVLIRSEGQEAPVARANLTYSIPPNRG